MENTNQVVEWYFSFIVFLRETHSSGFRIVSFQRILTFLDSRELYSGFASLGFEQMRDDGRSNVFMGNPTAAA